MVAQLPNLSEHQQLLIAQLKELPQEWALTPIYGDKKPYRTNWQSEVPVTKDLIERDIRNGKAKGYGLRTGKVSGGIIAIDADGYAPHEKILELSGGVPLPETVAFTSNKPGRCQYLFFVPQEYWEAIATKKIGTGVKGDDGKELLLELRWDGCQSVLPPSIHPETGFYRWRKSPQEVAIAPCPMWIIEQMLDDPKRGYPNQIQLPVDAIIPLTACLTHRSRDMLSTGAAAPDKGRNDSGIELARDLIGTANYLDSLGQRYEGNAENLFFDWCHVCGLDSDKPKGQPKAIWKSGNKGNSTPGSGKDGVDACIRGWYWRENIKPTGRGYGGGIGSGGGRRGNGGSGGSGGGDGGNGGDGGDCGKILRFPATELNMVAIREQIKGILSRDLPPSELEATKIQIRVAAPAISEREFRQLWNAVELELELEQSRGDRAKEVDDLVKLGDQSLNLSDFLPADLSRPVTAWCKWLSIRPETALTALLCGASSLHKAGTELVISRKRNFTVPPTIYGALISESGQKKSPIYRTLIRQPLDALEIDAEEQFKAAMEDWREEMKVWHANGSQGEAPAEPIPPPIWYFTDANGEGIKAQANKHPSKTLMGLIDELAGLFNSHDKYRNGKGSDRQDMLSYFDGTGAKVLRASGVKANVRKLYLSLFGTIQPDVLKRMMSDCSDPDGQWARFLFVSQPLSPSDLDDDDYSIDIVERITDLYRWLDKVPEMEYTLSSAAYERYKPVYKQLERLRVSHPQAGMRAVYSKMEGYIGRLAINLHVLHEWAAFKVTPDAEIPLEIMERAIALAKFYIGQVKLVHFNSDDSELAPTLVKLINYSKLLESVGKDGWVKAKDFVNGITKTKRPKVDVARSWMREAESLGFGCTRGTGCHLEYHWNSDNNPKLPPDPHQKKVDEVDKKETKVDESSTAEMTIYHAFQEKVDEVDDLSIFSNQSLDDTQHRVEEQSPSNTFEEKHNISGGSSTSSTFSCNDRISMVTAVDESSTFYLPENQASTFSATGSVSTIDAVNSERASRSLATNDTGDEEEQGNEDLEEWGACRCAEEMDVYVRGEEGIWTVTKSLPAYAELQRGNLHLIRGWSDIRVSI